MKRILFIVLVFSIFYSELIAEDDINIMSAVGLYGGLNINMHSPSFNYPIDQSTKVLFNNNATGIGADLGFIGIFPLNKILALSGRFGYNGLGGLMTKNINNKRYELDASLNYIEISPILQIYNLLPYKKVYLLTGLETGIPLSPKYNLTDGSKNYIKENENIANADFRMAITIGAGYIYKLSDGFNLRPEISLRFPLSNVSSNQSFTTWEVPQIRFDLSFTFDLEKPQETPKPEISTLNVGFKEVRYYDKKGDYYPLERIKVEDLKYTEEFPIIPYVFFDEKQSKPSKQMQSLSAKTKAGEFTISGLQPDAININRSTLDIIGRRLQEYPRSELTVTGTIDNKTEINDTTLAFKRAEFVKNYLVDNYKINPEMINVRAIGLPEKPSAVNDSDGVAENRRVELKSSNPKILEPIIIQKENQTIANPNLIEFVPYVESTDSVVSWDLTISQQGEIIRTFKGSGIPGYIAWVIIPNELVKSEIPIEYVLTVKNSKGIEKNAAGTIPIDYYSFTRKKTEDLPDKTIAKFNLILFDFDDDRISKSDLDVINKDILPLIKYNSTVKIYGYTDRIGNAPYNKSLANRRALSVKKYLQSKVKTAKFEVYGVGENELLYDNNLPIGRQLSRTVQIFIITPR